MSRKIALCVVMLCFAALSFANHNETLPITHHNETVESMLNKRQGATRVADFYYNSGGSTLYAILYAGSGMDGATTTDVNGNPIVAGGGIGISSLRVLDQNWLVELYGSPTCTGSSLAFRTTVLINNLADYGYNDWAACLVARWKGPISGAVTLFEDANYGGRSAYLELGSRPDISTASTYLNNVRGDRLSSMEVYPNTQVNLYKNTFYGGQKGGPAPSAKLGVTVSYPSMSSVPPSPGFCNDCASSIQVY